VHPTAPDEPSAPGSLAGPAARQHLRRCARTGSNAGGAGHIRPRDPAHSALVSEADFIAAQQATGLRGPAGSAARRYLLAGLLTCGRCGRRLESAWSNGKTEAGRGVSYRLCR
jgi:hypothetical protein